MVPRALGLTLQRFDLSPRPSGVGPNAQTNTHSAMYFPRVRGGLAAPRGAFWPPVRRVAV